MSATIDPRLLELFTEIAVIPGMSGSERAMADYVRSFTQKLGLRCYEDDTNILWNGDTGNLFCPMGASAGSFLLAAHMDTPRPTKDTKIIVDDEKITSDGTTALGVDNRAGVALLLYVMERVVRERLPIKECSVAFMTCEETTLDGSMNIPLPESIRMGFVFDSSMRPGNFVYESCGAVRFVARIHGKPAHAGIAPEKGVHALRAAAEAICALRLGRVDEKTTLNAGTMRSGEAVNVIPDLAIVEGEIRSMRWERIESLIEETSETFCRAAERYGATVEFETRADFTPYSLQPNEPVFERISTAIRNAGLQPEPQISWGGSDANSLNKRGVPSVNIGIGAQNPHANTEFILLEDFQNAANIALEVMSC